MSAQPANVLFDFVLEKTSGELPARRATLYRALAIVIGSEKEAAALNMLAAECDAIDAKHHQLVLDFKHRAQGSDRNGRAEG